MAANQPTFGNQIFEMWSRLQWSQRLTIVFFAFLGIALIGSIVYFMNRVEYRPLYRDLDPEDAQAIAAKLEEEKKDFMVRGTSILVAAPENEIDKLRLEIAGSGLGRSGRIGYEIFDENQFGMTDFTEQINFQRALEGELARTVSSLSEISQARVHLVLPKDSPFAADREPAKASVVVRLKKGSELSKSGIAGIKGVVAGAVRGLYTHNVSIVDSEGRLLSRSVESGESAQSEIESGIREQLEREMAGKVVSILEPLVGKGKVHANASIDLDFNTTEQTEETFNPNPPVVLSQQRIEERSSNSPIASGIPGTQSNLNESIPPLALSSPEHVRQSEVTNYEVNKLVRHTIQPKGTIRRLSVAVILDHNTIYKEDEDGELITTTEPRTQAEMEDYRDLVLAAVGYNEERGDVVTIENVVFYSDSKPEEPQAPVPWHLPWRPYIMPAIKYSSFIVLFLLVYFILIRPIRSRVFQAMSFAALGPGESNNMQLSFENKPAELPTARAPEEISAPPTAAVAASPPPSEAPEPEELFSLEKSDEQIERELMKEANMIDLGGRKYAAMKKKLVEKAQKEPEMVSQLLRTLLREKA
jgi:flagellar M-ring protein FliF